MLENELRKLFERLFTASCESEVEKLFINSEFSLVLNNQDNWKPLGGNESNYGVIENQQSSPIAALIEKVTNSIDATLMKKCLEMGIDPKSDDAPQSMEDALDYFYPPGSDNPYSCFKAIPADQRKQSKEIQILADGPKRDTSLIIYDNGEGQHPEDFENTFLSLLRGNKNEIHFVQGKYNMGGTGAIVFCGKKRYQLIASKRYDGTGLFGFTLVREHPLSESEHQSKKNTWYEYLKIDGAIPAFEIDSLDLKLDERQFTTGSIIKLYSYKLPTGNAMINRDLNQSLNEFLFEPALPIAVVERKERYPNDNNPSRYLYGLKRHLEKPRTKEKYIDRVFSETNESSNFGKLKVMSYLFKNKVEDKDIKSTRKTIQSEFFKNNMAVMFSVNGQVHGHYTSEFITRSLKMPIFKDYLLIEVDCTHMNYEVRKELFMASRDRLKGSEETKALRDALTTLLKNSELKDLHKRRREALSVSSGDTNDLLKSFTKSLPLNSDLMKLLDSTFKLDLSNDKKKKKAPEKSKKTKDSKQETPFNPQRYPSFFNLPKSGTEERPAAQIPLEGQRSIKLETDVENEYFDRSDDPGDLQLSLLSHKSNESSGGNYPGTPKELSDLLNVTKSSPDKGKIRIAMSPTENIDAGDVVQVKASLLGAGETFEQAFWVKIVEKEKPKEKTPQKEDDTPKICLPNFQLVYREKKDDGHKSWEEFETLAGAEMDHNEILHPMTGENDDLETIFINMDSRVILHKRKSCKSEEQILIAEKKYISSVYFHSLFLFTISKKKKLQMREESGREIELSEYVKGLFSTFYSEFLLNFGLDDLMDTLSV